jgi:hypothetical protein
MISVVRTEVLWMIVRKKISSQIKIGPKEELHTTEY